MASKKKNYLDDALEFRPVLKNSDGSTSSELTITIDTKRGFMNVPTINPKERRSLTIKEGLRQERKAGGKTFKTKEEAEDAAKKRSGAGGRYRKRDGK